MSDPARKENLPGTESSINISISSSPHRERGGGYLRETGCSISSELFSAYQDSPTRRIVYDSIMGTFIVKEYDPQNYKDKKVISERKPTDWEILGLVEMGLEALTTPGFLDKKSPDYFSPGRHLYSLISVGTEKVEKDAQQMLGRIAKIKQKMPPQRQS